MAHKQKKLHSFESLIDRYILFTVAILLCLLATIFYITSASILTITTSLLVIIIPFIALSFYIKKTIQVPLNSLAASLEAVRNEDYSLRINPKFNHGAIKTLSEEVSLMASDLKVRKLHYDQHAVLVLNLIKQLETPIAVFDHNGRLKHANDAFSAWCGTPWKQIKDLKAESVGLEYIKKKQPIKKESASNIKSIWQIKHQDLADNWQLRHSQFSMQDEDFQLVILTNIEQLVHQTEQTAWHKMTRVLSHEINNSLSPIKSLAQSLAEIFEQQQLDNNAKQALEVIVDRSDSLMQFVNRYASLAQQFEVNFESVNLEILINKVAALFSHDITISISATKVKADKVLLEQVLINLVKNAIEASKNNHQIKVITKHNEKQVIIEILDSGVGIANPDNLFVPFYTTKEAGKGIGLALCRNMIEQQGGRLSLQNRAEHAGAIATIRLAS